MCSCKNVSTHDTNNEAFDKIENKTLNQMTQHFLTYLCQFHTK
jgi:hypothetical protein